MTNTLSIVTERVDDIPDALERRYEMDAFGTSAVGGDGGSV